MQCRKYATARGHEEFIIGVMACKGSAKGEEPSATEFSQVCTYIYIYTHTYIDIYIHIHIIHI